MSTAPLLSDPHLLFSVTVFLAAGVVKGVVGLGLPTLAMALLALRMPPAQAAALLILPSLVTNVWQMRPWRTLPALARRLGPMQVGVVVGTLAGAWWLGAPSGAWAEAALGVALIAYGGWGLAGAQLPRVSDAAQRVAGPLVGAATGLVTAMTGVFVVPAVPYLQALGLARDELVQAMGLAFTVSTVALALGLALNQQYPATAAAGSALLVLPALIGMQAGQWLRQRLSPARFKLCFMGALVLLGAWMVARAW
ncbi:sulfite exporter TauE/SafE family protein [Ottowia sp. GY511]|uniref:Probable membrane transporter protein n=1 Tax=Ottowia flava TaxID=2675430 RepID=A0ABW4KNQ0_9BURK|nr:sulfite exporter TauE/SafE family protein [Ottowia sp. GY511]TXK26796.1 sulfite exporter TauE/SafE family protein [Ottowia sp. GY511]